MILVGAGPGDPDLLTVKAVRWLQQAEVVLTDRLVSQRIIEEFVTGSAQVIAVGKQCRRGASTPQSTINELMIRYAEEGRLVVRLKGGDVSIFSNILDELQVLTDRAIPYEIVPGITAALGAAAYAGIPLTARNHATAVRFLTCHQPNELSEEYWKELAQTDDTLVFYMSAETLPAVVEKLTANRIDPRKLLAVVEQATTPNQYVQAGSLYDYAEVFGQRRLASPSLVIIGRVVALHYQFNWVENSIVAEEYFRPLEGRLVTHQRKESTPISLSA